MHSYKLTNHNDKLTNHNDKLTNHNDKLTNHNDKLTNHNDKYNIENNRQFNLTGLPDKLRKYYRYNTNCAIQSAWIEYYNSKLTKS